MLRTCRFAARALTASHGKVSRGRFLATVTDSPVQQTKSKTGVNIVSVQDGSPASSLAVVVKAGPRAETADNVGVANYLKNFAFKNTTKRTAFRQVREAELVGGVLSASLTREYLILYTEFLRDGLPFFTELLADVVTKTKFTPHEFKEVKEKVEFQTSAAHSVPYAIAMDAAHAVAFRNGLGNSLFSSEASKVHDPDTVKSFASKVYTVPNITIVGTSVDHQNLVALTNDFFDEISAGSPVSTGASKYAGGDARIATSSEKSHFVLAFPGAAAGAQDAAAFQVLRFVLDGDKHTKWGEGASPLAQASRKNAADASITTFNASYSDAGLFGVYIEGSPASVAVAAQAATEQLSKLTRGVSKNDFERAVANAKLDAASAYDTRDSVSQVVGDQVLATGVANPTSKVLDQIKGVKPSDIQNLATKIANCRPTAVGVGDVMSLPYSDSLSL